MRLRWELIACKKKRYIFAGQASVEYVIVIASLLVIVVALGSLWHFFADQGMLNRVFMHASHSIPHGLLDILRY